MQVDRKVLVQSEWVGVVDGRDRRHDLYVPEETQYGAAVI